MGVSVCVYLHISSYQASHSRPPSLCLLYGLWKSLTVGVSASLMYEDISAIFQGPVSPSGSFELNGFIHDVTIETIDTLFKRISNESLSLPAVDATIGTASLTMSSGGGP